MARTGDDRPQPDPDVLTARELAARLGIKDPETVRTQAAAGTLPGWRAGREWRFSWSEIYEWIAGPGIPPGDIVSAAELAARLGVSRGVVTRAAAAPGTPGSAPGTGTMPGRMAGGQWRFAVEAVWRAMPGTSSRVAARLGVSAGSGDTAGG